MTAHFAHLYDLKDSKIIRMRQYVDIGMVRQALI